MRRLLSGVARFSDGKAVRLLVAGALAASVSLAFAQRGGSMAGGHIAGGFAGHVGAGFAGQFGGGNYGHSFAGYAAPHFVSGFGPHSITGAPGANFVRPGFGRAPNYASSWGIGHPTSRTGNEGWNRGGGRDRDRDRFRSPYVGYGYGYPYLPVYNSWALMPWDIGYPDFSGYSTDNSQNTAAAAPEYNEPASQQDEYRAPYNPPESDYAPPPPSAAPETSSTVLDTEPALTLIFKDGHQQSIRNYALTGDAVIILDKASSGRQERVPLVDLNLPATEQAAQAAGLDFAPPQ